jgi:hypothetical protein
VSTSASPSAAAGHHSSGHSSDHPSRRRRPRSSSYRRRNLTIYGLITLVCVVVAGFLAIMQWYATQIDFEEMKSKAQESMTDQVKEQMLKELQKRK